MNEQNLEIGCSPEASAEESTQQGILTSPLLKSIPLPSSPLGSKSSTSLPLGNKGRCKELCSAAAQLNCPPFQAAAAEGRSQFRDHRRGYSQISGEYLARPAMRHNESNGSADELMSELNVGEPAANLTEQEGQRGWKYHPLINP